MAAATLAKVTLIGRLGADPQTGQTNNGANYATFSVAVGDKNKENTQWFRVTAFNGLGNVVAQYLTKGREVYVEGRLELQQWEDQNGQMRTTAQVVANELKMLGGGNGGNAQGHSGSGNSQYGRNGNQPRNAQRRNGGNGGSSDYARNNAPQNRTQPPRNQPTGNYAGNDYNPEFDPGPEF